MKNLFSDVSVHLRIFKAETKLVLGKEMVLGEIATASTRILERQGPTNVVKEGPTTRDRAMRMKSLKCLITHRACRITHDKPTEGRPCLK